MWIAIASAFRTIIGVTANYGPPPKRTFNVTYQHSDEYSPVHTERHVMAITMYIERGATLAKPCSLDTPAMTKLRQAIQTIPH